MKLKDEKLWNEWVENNKDPQGKRYIGVACKVMEYLDEDKASLTEERVIVLITKSALELKLKGMTGVMYDYVAKMVSGCHIRGNDFLKAWKRKIGKTLTPAVSITAIEGIEREYYSQLHRQVIESMEVIVRWNGLCGKESNIKQQSKEIIPNSPERHRDYPNKTRKVWESYPESLAEHYLCDFRQSKYRIKANLKPVRTEKNETVDRIINNTKVILKWNGKFVGESNLNRFNTDGTAGRCPHCGCSSLSPDYPEQGLFGDDFKLSEYIYKLKGE